MNLEIEYWEGPDGPIVRIILYRGEFSTTTRSIPYKEGVEMRLWPSPPLTVGARERFDQFISWLKAAASLGPGGHRGKGGES